LAIDGRLFVGCATGAIEILTIQPAGKGKMAASAFLRGHGKRLGGFLEGLIDTDEAACDVSVKEGHL
jgi:hypothetical protein